MSNPCYTNLVVVGWEFSLFAFHCTCLCLCLAGGELSACEAAKQMGPEHASHTPLLGLVLLEGGGGTPQKHTTETAGRTTQATYAACHTLFAAMLGACFVFSEKP